MNEITLRNKLPAKRKTSPAAVLAELGNMELAHQHTRRMNRGLSFDDWSQHEIEPARQHAAVCRAYVGSQAYTDTSADLDAAMEEADRSFIAQQLDVLLANFGTSDAKAAFVLAAYVAARPMSRYAICKAVAELISTATYPPRTAEVLKAVAEAEDILQYTHELHRELPKRVDAAERQIARADARKAAQ